MTSSKRRNFLSKRETRIVLQATGWPSATSTHILGNCGGDSCVCAKTKKKPKKSFLMFLVQTKQIPIIWV